MDNNLPKKIWFLWLQGLDNAPLVVKKCYESWPRHNPHWEFIFLDKDNINQYIDLQEYNTTKPAFSDLLRINLLAKYGGVWVDATCFCMKPLDEWLYDNLQSGFFAFDRPVPTRMIGSWFLAGNKYNYIISTFKARANAYWNENPDMRFIETSELSFLNKRLNRRNNRIWFSWFITKILKVYPYFWIHYLFEYVYYRDKNFKEMWDSSPKFSADIPHAVFFAGFEKPLTPEIKMHIDNKLSPVYKLTWKYDTEAAHKPGTILDYLFNNQ
ncbi:MAG: capsular polysaccharide synthesis protein [Sphingobacteriales bacterium]